MLFILRQLRRSFFQPGKFRTYVAYAVGEILLIVIGILIALQIQNWNEEQKDVNERQLLVARLIQDFETTKQRIKLGREEATLTLKFGSFLLLTDPLDESVPLEQWEEAASNAWEKVDFEPVTATYQSAVDTGNIGLLESSDLLEAFAEFKQFNDSYELHDRYSSEIFYTGVNSDAAKEIGSVRLLWGNLKEYPVRAERIKWNLREIFSRPTVVATVELYWQAISNVDYDLERMDIAVDRILDELKQLQND